MFDKLINKTCKTVEGYGWEVIDVDNDQDTPINIVAFDENDETHVIQVCGKDMNCEDYDREFVESQFICWLSENEDFMTGDDFMIHFDKFVYTVVNPKRAFVKMHFDYM